ncbi:MAG: HAD family hydrolase [Alphaproteobacteria bacterium]|nr:HAD family hydrolase [Alphaproteobacteria bacterium]
MTTDNISLLIMDFDGTIAETLEDVAFCMKKTFEYYGLRAPDYLAVHATVGLTLEDSFRVLSDGAVRKDKVGEWVYFYRDLYKKEGGMRTRLFHGMDQAMQTAHEKGVKILVVSNKGMSAIQAALSKLGVAQYVDQILSGDTVTHKKPDSGLYSEEIKKLYPDVKDDEVLVVGDTIIDLTFAKNAELRSCWASYGYGKSEECLACGPTFIIKEATELASLIEKAKKADPSEEKTAKSEDRTNIQKVEPTEISSSLNNH